MFEPGVISTAAVETAPAFTPDGKTVYFSRGNNAGASIVVSHRQGAHWSKPSLAPFSGVWCDMEPSVSPDGKFLIFVSNRPVTAGGAVLDGRWSNKAYPGLGGNLWRVELTASGPSEPVRLPEAVNVGSSVFAPAIFPDGSLLFMSPDAKTNRFQLWRSTLVNGAYQPAERVAFAQPDATECDPAVSPDGRYVVFSSTRAPALAMDLFIVFRENAGWGTPLHLGPEVNSPGSDTEARLSPDGKTLYFSSDRLLPVKYPRTRAQTQAELERAEAYDNGLYNIWQVSLAPWLEQR